VTWIRERFSASANSEAGSKDSQKALSEEAVKHWSDCENGYGIFREPWRCSGALVDGMIRC
jgi:hypothetical protein